MDKPPTDANRILSIPTQKETVTDWASFRLETQTRSDPEACARGTVGGARPTSMRRADQMFELWMFQDGCGDQKIAARGTSAGFSLWFPGAILVHVFEPQPDVLEP